MEGKIKNYFLIRFVSLLIGAIIHFASKFFNFLIYFVMLNYLHTGDTGDTKILFEINGFLSNIFYFGHIFYFLGYYVLIKYLRLKYKSFILIFLIINLLLYTSYKILPIVGVAPKVYMVLNYLTQASEILKCVLFIIAIINFKVPRRTHLILISFITELILRIISLKVYDSYITAETRYYILIFSSFGFMFCNLMFIIFSIYHINNINIKGDIRR